MHWEKIFSKYFFLNVQIWMLIIMYIIIQKIVLFFLTANLILFIPQNSLSEASFKTALWRNEFYSNEIWSLKGQDVYESQDSCNRDPEETDIVAFFLSRCWHKD